MQQVEKKKKEKEKEREASGNEEDVRPDRCAAERVPGRWLRMLWAMLSSGSACALP